MNNKGGYKLRTTKKELLKMIENISNNTQIILQVRGNSTTDYSEQRISAYENVNGILIIKDKLSL